MIVSDTGKAAALGGQAQFTFEVPQFAPKAFQIYVSGDDPSTLSVDASGLLATSTNARMLIDSVPVQCINDAELFRDGIDINERMKEIVITITNDGGYEQDVIVVVKWDIPQNGKSFDSWPRGPVVSVTTESGVTAFGKNHLDGYPLTYVDDHTLRIGVGTCLSSDNEALIENTLDIDIDLTASGANGLDTGSEASSTWYFVFVAFMPGGPLAEGTTTSTSSGKLVDANATFQTDGVSAGDAVYNSTDGTWTKVSSVDSETQLTIADDIFTISEDYQVKPEVIGLFSTSATSLTMPSGYTRKRRVGAIRNDTSSNFLHIHQYQYGRKRLYRYDEIDATLAILSNGSATIFTAVDMSSLVSPTSLGIEIVLGFEAGGGAAADVMEIQPNEWSTGCYTYKPGYIPSGQKLMLKWDVATNSQSIKYKVTDDKNKADIYVRGFSEVL